MMTAATMDAAVRPFVGRERELDALRQSLADADTGTGCVWLLVGEPGIGKSRLVETVAREADERGLLVAWGRAWEAGGAPPFWPWVQVLRTVLRRRSPAGDRSGVLSQLLPELGASPIEAARTRPDEARFRLLDAVVGALLDAAEAVPLCVVLEDLHVADTSSLLLLELLASQVRTARIVVVGTQREAGTTGPGTHLTRIAREARRVALPRFGRPEVEAFLRATVGEAPADARVDALLAASEGNPLFLSELAHWAEDPRHTPDTIPGTLRALIRDRLVGLSQDEAELLDVASVLGRDVGLSVLAAACDRPVAEAEAALDNIARTGVLEPVGPRRRRFSHVLVRECLYDEIDPERREALHLRCADACLAVAADAEPPWSELAHHLLRAGSEGRERGLEAAICAAERAQAQYAFHDAVAWLERALEAAADASWSRRAELMLALGRARMSAGELEAGRLLCAEAAAMARQHDDVMLLARAALEYGSVFVVALVNDTLVALLREALEGLPQRERGLRARVQARLAAALQPADDPKGPIEMARDAVAQARTIGDPAILLDVVRSAGSAMADLAPPLERRALDREHVALADRLGDAGEGLRGAVRLLLDTLELGDGAEAATTIATCERLCEQLGSVHALWRGAAMRAVVDLYRGCFADAGVSWGRATALAEQAGDPNARRGLAMQAVFSAMLQGRDDLARERLPALEGAVDGPVGTLIFRLLRAVLLARGGERPDVAALAGDLEETLRLDDISPIVLAADIAVLAGDRALAQNLLDRLPRWNDHLANHGVTCMFVGEPVALYMGRLERLLGRDDRARAHLERADELARRAGARAGRFWALLELAELDPRRRAEAEALARELNAPGLLARVHASAPEPSTVDETLTVRRLGDVWEVRAGETAVYVRDTKGARMLARLVEQPGQRLHVLDLVDDGTGGVVDIGDAGPLIDEQARDAYRDRIDALQGELEEAERWNDTARATAAREEIEAIQAELARALGLGGRPRRAPAAVERARINVQRRIKDVIRRVHADSKPLADRLTRSIRTGTHCIYED